MTDTAETTIRLTERERSVALEALTYRGGKWRVSIRSMRAAGDRDDEADALAERLTVLDEVRGMLGGETPT